MQRTRYGRAATALAAMVLLAGCARDRPETIPVSGKVTYEDGSLVPANRMELRFLAQPEVVRAKDYPPAATARVDTRDGTFSEMTTWMHGDGVIPGEYEVEVVRYGSEEEPGGIKAVRYRGDRVWPNSVTVSAESNTFHVTIPRG